jgi:hypothetical protein
VLRKRLWPKGAAQEFEMNLPCRPVRMIAPDAGFHHVAYKLRHLAGKARTLLVGHLSQDARLHLANLAGGV